MYHKNYEEITESVINSNKDLKLFNWITNQFTYKRIETSLSFLDCTVSVSQTQFAKMLKKLVDIKYIKRRKRGIYRLNPYIYVPYNANGSELQEEWNNIK